MARTEEEQKGISLLGNQHVAYPSDYSADILETFINKHPDNDYFVKFNCTEFTSLCHCEISEFQRKCYGDIEIAISDGAKITKTIPMSSASATPEISPNAVPFFTLSYCFAPRF